MWAVTKRREVEAASNKAHKALATREEEVMSLKSEIDVLSKLVLQLRHAATEESEQFEHEIRSYRQQFSKYDQRYMDKVEEVRALEAERRKLQEAHAAEQECQATVETDRRRAHMSRIAMRRVTDRRLQQACWSWKAQAVVQCRRRLKSLKLIHRWKSYLLMERYDKWRQLAAERRQFQAKTRKIVARLMNQKLMGAYVQWQGQAKETRRSKAKAARVVIRLIKNLLVDGYDTWRENTREQIQMKAKSQKIIYRLKHACLVNCFEGWRDNTQEQIQMKVKSQKIIYRLKHACLVRSFLCWQADVLEEADYLDLQLEVAAIRLELRAAKDDAEFAMRESEIERGRLNGRLMEAAALKSHLQGTVAALRKELAESQGSLEAAKKMVQEHEEKFEENEEEIQRLQEQLVLQLVKGSPLKRRAGV